MKVKYDALLSFWILFIFLAALFFRMTWKYDYNFNHELIDINEEVEPFVKDYIDNFQTYTIQTNSEFKNVIQPYLSDIEHILVENENSRTDYLYLIEREKEDLLTFYNTQVFQRGDEDYYKIVSAYKDFAKINQGYKTFKAFSIISAILFAGTFTPWLILKITHKNKKRDLQY